MAADPLQVVPTVSFPLGQLAYTPRAEDLLGLLGITALINRHAGGDWGDNLSDFDKEQNRRALENGDRLVSVYEVDGESVYVVTEADRSVTTCLLATEY